ncbi:MAG: iron-containing alcohol dehydrogenase, partial [Alkalispirochaeta sp.]
MSNLSYFSFPTGIIYGVGAIGELPGVLREMGVSRPIIITDAALTKTAAFTRVKEVLDGSGEEYHVFSDVHPNPLDTDVEAALEVYRHGRCDGIVGLGGGSPLDTAKALAVLASNGGDLARYDVQTSGGKYVTKPLPPIVGIPTTAGTGSEVGKCAVITSTRDHRKYMVCHPWMLPGRAILDAELTVSLPPVLTAATGMDALTHCIESLTAPIFHPMCDGIALKGIEFVVANLEKAVKTPTDLEARGRMLLAASMGAVAFQKDLGAAHSISHALSAVCGVQHGLANAILLPPV